MSLWHVEAILYVVNVHICLVEQVTWHIIKKAMDLFL